MFSFEVNYLAILVGGVAAMAVGAVWYGAFAEPWMRLNNLTKEDVNRSQLPAMYGVAFVGALLMGFVMANIIEAFGVRTWNDAVVVAFLTWLGLNGLSHITVSMFSNRSAKLGLLDAGKELTVMIVLALIFTFWN